MWIDSLCIVQDDNADWKNESACMAAIYHHNYLKIATTGGSDSTVGCLNTRSLKQLSFQFGTKSHGITYKQRHDYDSLD
jgi:hypothetical protein